MNRISDLSDEDLAEKVANHVLQYRGISESTRLLEELLDRFTKQRNILNEVLK